MSEEYQLRRDVDRIYDLTYDLQNNEPNIYTKSEVNEILDRDYFDQSEVLKLIQESGGGGGGDLSNYYTKTEINGILSSYATISFANSTYAPIVHTHSQYVTREEISDLDINLTTLELVPKTDNPNGVMCFDRVQKTIDELDIDLKADTMANGYLKIEVDLIEVTRSVNNGNSS